MAVNQRDVVLQQIREFVLLNFIMADETLGEHDSLSGEGIIDSAGLLELVLFLEERFDLHIPDQDILPEQFDSLARLADYIMLRSTHQLSAVR
jgi:acyl carrier protein